MSFWFYLACRWFGIASILLLLQAVHAESSITNPPNPEGKLWVYVGTYTGEASKGIYRFELDLNSGKLASKGLAAATVSPSFLALHPNHRFLYAVNEISDLEGKATGGVSAFAIEPITGRLSFLNQQPSGGTGPCYLVVDPNGKHVMVANYGSGSVCVLPVDANGKLGRATSVVQHHGNSTIKNRQEGPHAHCILLDASSRFSLVADLGLDKILVYRFDANQGTLTPNDPPFVAAAPGSGPRHLAFSPDGRYVYAVNEINSSITAFAYDSTRGVLRELQTASTLPRDFTRDNSGAEIQVHSGGRFLYASNRGHHSIAIFAIDSETGKLKVVGYQTHEIKTPRNFAIDPSGTFLMVANQDGNSLLVFRINLKTGELFPVGPPTVAPNPVCITMMSPPK